MRPILSSFLLMTLTAGSGSAEEAKPLSQVFLDRCLLVGPHFNKMVAAAKDGGWTPLAADMAMAFTPVGDPVAIEGWLIGDGETRSFEALVGFRAKVGEKSVEGCTMAVADVNAPAFEKQIVTRASAKAEGQDEAQDTIYKRFSTRIDGRDVALTISLPRYPKGADQIIVSLVAEEALEN